MILMSRLNQLEQLKQQKNETKKIRVEINTSHGIISIPAILNDRGEYVISPDMIIRRIEYIY